MSPHSECTIRSNVESIARINYVACVEDEVAVSLDANSFGRRLSADTSFPELTKLLRRIKDVYAPLEVLLYGSRARGEANADSDWDIKVIVSDDAPDTLFSPMVGWKVQEGSGVYADISCARLSEFQSDLIVANSAAREIARSGIALEFS